MLKSNPRTKGNPITTCNRKISIFQDEMEESCVTGYECFKKLTSFDYTQTTGRTTFKLKRKRSWLPGLPSWLTVKRYILIIHNFISFIIPLNFVNYRVR